jgi:hypothetical protein
MQRREKSVHLQVGVDCNLRAFAFFVHCMQSPAFGIVFTVVGPSSVSCVKHVGGD